MVENSLIYSEQVVFAATNKQKNNDDSLQYKLRQMFNIFRDLNL